MALARARPVARVIGGTAPLEAIATILDGADVVVVNFEGALGEAVAGPVRMVAPASGHDEAVAWLARLGGLDVLTVANNHALDAGAAGLARLEAAARVRGIDVVGGRDGTIVRVVRNRRFAFVALTDRVNPGDRAGPQWVPSARLGAAMIERVRAASVIADEVIVLVHWGAELAPGPSVIQRDAARAAIDAGARLVIGTGAHVVQAIERYREGLIAWSLGNLLFDQRSRPETRMGLLLAVEVGVRGLTWQAIPTAAADDDRPHPRP